MSEQAIAIRETKETAVASVSAQAQASIQARYQVAYARPRNWDQVRTQLLHECKRPKFCQVARWTRPVGRSTITGPSIRFVEAAHRCMTNMLTESPTIYEDARKRLVRVTVTDLETNLTYTKDIVIAKTVERRMLKPGQVPISERLNSRGETVYQVEATDDEVTAKEAASVSKVMRTLGLRLIPGDLVDEAMEAIDATATDTAAKDPDAERKKLVDAFATLGVQPSDLVAWLTHDLSKCTPKEIVELRTMYTAIASGEASWADFTSPTVDEDAKKEETKTNRVKDELRKRRENSHGQ